MEIPEPDVWYYAAADGERRGPVTIRQLSDLAGRGLLTAESLVWSPGSTSWVPAGSIADRLIAARTPAGPPPAPAAPAPEPDEPELELKPRKASFIFPRIVLGSLAALVAGGVTAGVLAALEKPPWSGLAVFLVLALLAVASAVVGYRKERYRVGNSRILSHSGGLFNDQTTELEIRNITLVQLRLPWLRHKFFGIGHVIISTAGNARPVVMRAIRGPEEVFAAVRRRMKRNGYELTQTQLLHEEQPAMTGILGECVGALAGMFMAALFGLPLVTAVREEMQGRMPAYLLPALLALAIVGLAGFIVIRYLDFRRRTYRVYGDVVVYDEGFLTRENAFIPYENLADANTRRTLFDRVFGLYDVQVSCQGSGKEISFRHLRRGEALSAAIDQLVALARGKARPQGERGRAAAARPRRVEPAAVPLSETLTGDFGMNATRTLLPLLFLLPLLPLWVGAMIQAAIRLAGTKYVVRPGSIRSSFRFITVSEREFAYDKITGLVIKRNLWDRMFGTLTLRFWSIGSGQPIEFAHVHANHIDLPALMRQAGIPAASPAPWEAHTPFRAGVWLRAGVKSLPWLLVFAVAVIVAGLRLDPRLHWLLLLPLPVIAGFFLRATLYCGRQRLRFHDHHVEAEQGVIARRHYFARYANIKRTMTTRYPGGADGDLQVFVAGEEEVQQAAQQPQGRQKILRPCSFTTRYLPAARETGMLLDDILAGRVEPSPQAVAADPPAVILEAPRAVANVVAKLALASILLLPLVLLLPLTLPLTVARTKRWRYAVDEIRVVLRRGLLYRSETTILLDRVDSLQQSQGPLNKTFRNGNVAIMTAGSSKPDLVLPDSPAYLELYRVIRENSR
jgi:uncharacterized membrane protein YdbT with pleckstrin-like domain